MQILIIGYIELFFYLIGLNIKEIYPQMFDNYDKLSKKYREYIANNPPKTIGY